MIGIQVKNQQGWYQIDSRFIGFSVYDRGTVYPEMYIPLSSPSLQHNFVGWGHSSYVEGGKLLFQPNYGQVGEVVEREAANATYQFGTQGKPKGTIMLFQAHTPSSIFPIRPINWVVIAPTNYLPNKPSDYGLEVWDKNQDKVFSSSYPLAYLVQVIRLTPTSQVIGNGTTLHFNQLTRKVTLPPLPAGEEYFVGGVEPHRLYPRRFGDYGTLISFRIARISQWTYELNTLGYDVYPADYPAVPDGLTNLMKDGDFYVEFYRVKV